MMDTANSGTGKRINMLIALFTNILLFSSILKAYHCMMSLQDFITRWNGEGIDYDKSYGFQCMDLYRQYVKDVLGFPQSPSVVGAKDVWDTYLKDKFDRIANTPSGFPRKGDIVIWGTKVGKYGHIAICNEANATSFSSFDQNWPDTGGKGVSHIQSHNYTGVLGWLRPKVDSPPPPANNDFMTFDLFGDKSNNKIYYRGFDNVLQHIPGPDDLRNLWGDNPTVTWVDNISQVTGEPIENVYAERDRLYQSEKDKDAAYATLRKETDALSAGVLAGNQKIADLETRIVKINKDNAEIFASMNKELQNVKKQLEACQSSQPSTPPTTPPSQPTLSLWSQLAVFLKKLFTGKEN